MITLNTETFVPAETLSKYAVQYGWNEGTVEVTFMGKTRRVECLARPYIDSWILHGLCARYVTGTKVWPASVVMKDGKVHHISTGFESFSGRHSKPRLCGFTQDVSEQRVSKR